MTAFYSIFNNSSVFRDNEIVINITTIWIIFG